MFTVVLVNGTVAFVAATMVWLVLGEVLAKAVDDESGLAEAVTGAPWHCISTSSPGPRPTLFGRATAVEKSEKGATRNKAEDNILAVEDEEKVR